MTPEWGLLLAAHRAVCLEPVDLGHYHLITPSRHCASLTSSPHHFITPSLATAQSAREVRADVRERVHARASLNAAITFCSATSAPT